MRACIFAIATLVGTFALQTSLLAEMMTITATPKATSGGFRHNVFHSATGYGTSGSIKAYFDLDEDGPASWYDPDTGDLLLHVDLYSNSGLTNHIGTAVGTGEDLVGTEFWGNGGNNDGSLIGTIEWVFTFNAGTNALKTYLTNEGVGFTDLGSGVSQSDAMTLKFMDKKYATSINGDVANSYIEGDPNTLTLWGADGTPIGNSSGKFQYNSSTLGMDLVIEAEVQESPVVPEPSSLALLGIGGLGLCGWRRKRKMR